jgi:hypothetical protein
LIAALALKWSRIGVGHDRARAKAAITGPKTLVVDFRLAAHDLRRADRL